MRVDQFPDDLALRPFGCRSAPLITTFAPYGYRKVYVQDGVKKRPKLELDPPAEAMARRIFDMVLQGST